MTRETSGNSCRLTRAGRRIQVIYQDCAGSFERDFSLRAYQKAMGIFSRTGQAEVPTTRGAVTFSKTGKRISLGVDERYKGMNLIICDSGLSYEGLVNLAA